MLWSTTIASSICGCVACPSSSCALTCVCEYLHIIFHLIFHTSDIFPTWRVVSNRERSRKLNVEQSTFLRSQHVTQCSMMKQDKTGWMRPLHCEPASMQAFTCMRCASSHCMHLFFHDFALVNVRVSTSTLSHAPPRVFNTCDARSIQKCYILYLCGCADVCLEEKDFSTPWQILVASFLQFVPLNKANNVVWPPLQRRPPPRKHQARQTPEQLQWV